MEQLSTPLIATISVLLGTFVTCGLIGWFNSPATFPLSGKAVVVTGGSSGIGKAVAHECLARGAAHVVLLARRLDVLKAAAAELQAAADAAGAGQRVHCHSVDVTNAAATAGALEAAAKECGGALHGVVCSAGTSSPREFVAQSAQEFEDVLRLNVVGTRNAIAGALPFMPQRAGGRIVLVSSQAGQVGLYGYTAYSVRSAAARASARARAAFLTPLSPLFYPLLPQASKFALNGLAQSLSMELAPRRILVSLSFPPDTNTPLLAEENKSKPEITRLLSAATTTVQPEEVARGIVGGMEHFSPSISVGFDGWMLSTLTAGMGPAGSWGAAVVQVCTMGLWRAVALFYVQDFYSTVMKGSRAAAGDTK